ncbi:MAG: hypothetical protein ATN35_08585 [Epulopiscium sp. Nele67-Bin004]|nr:MAG: hypothetical protein ATN35_08585 [Epulopiscium sp. Nele67-Bin004]
MIEFSEQALDDLKKIDKKSQIRILDKIAEYNQSENPMKYAKSIKCAYDNIYRFRIGDYRLVFEKRGLELCLLIIIVEPRNKIYQKINRKLTKRLK